MSQFKTVVQGFWDKTPCGTREISHPEGCRGFFDQIESERDAREPFISEFARFSERREREVLEVGIGAATDFVRFARAGARLSGVDLTSHAVELAKKRLALEGLSADVRQGDAENLPFNRDSFDFVYSWGVIHHTEDTPRAAREIIRVTKPGGRVCVMIYHRFSLVAAQCWILNALLRGRPFRSLSEVIANHIESAGTKAYSIVEAREMFSALRDVRVTPVVTPYDVRLTQSYFLPHWFRKLLPSRLGWFLVVEGTK